MNTTSVGTISFAIRKELAMPQRLFMLKPEPYVSHSTARPMSLWDARVGVEIYLALYVPLVLGFVLAV